MLTAQDHLEAAQKIEDTLYKLENSEDIANALAKYEEHIRQAEILDNDACIEWAKKNLK